ncbi:MAG TPA: hypothetical protein VEL72_07725 [Ktedonobacteraceae bacterium]|nr:hypothetical protein [Ktedonobacteraceae bacterium]
MSIDEQHRATEPKAPSPTILSETQHKLWYRRLLSPVWLCLIAALLLRLFLIIHTHGMIDGDEALIGIQAERILQGHFPVYFYGIPYFGSLEAYLASILFAIFGSSPWTLRTEATLVSLVLVWLTWRLASCLADAAHLPPSAKTCFTLVAALTAAIPPLYDGLVELRTWGGYIETYVFMILLLLSALRLTQRWHEGTSQRELGLRWAGIGLIVGLGTWVYPLIVSAILAAALWIVLDRIITFVRVRRDLAANARRASIALRRALQPLLPIWTAIPASLLGASPAIAWGIKHSWANAQYLRQLGGTWSIQRIHTIHRVTNMYLSCVAPRIIGGSLPVESKLSAAFHSPLLIFTTFCIFATAALVLVSLVWHHPALLRIQRLAALPTLFAACAAIIYCTSSASAFSLISCGLDLAGRYATPLMLAFPFFFATIFTASFLAINAFSRNTSVGAGADVGRGAGHLDARVARPASADPNSVGTDNIAALATMLPGGRDKSRPYIIAAHLVIFALLLAYLGAQAWTYNLSYPNYDFQSPYCPIIPANYDPIITYMEQQHIRYAWATNLLGHPITFETNSRVIVVDPLEVTHPPLAINRIPAYTDAVYHANRPSLVVFVQHTDPRPLLLRLLDADQVTYHVARFPSEPAIDVMVVTPLSRTIQPYNPRYIKAFNCFTT